MPPYLSFITHPAKCDEGCIFNGLVVAQRLCLSGCVKSETLYCYYDDEEITCVSGCSQLTRM